MDRQPHKYIKKQAEMGIPSSSQVILNVIKKRKINKAALARIMTRSYYTVDSYLKKGSIQTAILWEISTILKHNFFADMAVLMPAEYAVSNNEIMQSKQAEIEALQASVKELQREKELLLDVIQRLGSK